jgi:hypothetical protein
MRNGLSEKIILPLNNSLFEFFIKGESIILLFKSTIKQDIYTVV